MPDFGFVGTSYEAPSIYQDAQECINFYAEIDPTKQPGSRGVVALYPTPGLVTQVSLPEGATVRGMRALSGDQILIAVSGNKVYKIDLKMVATQIGTLTTTTGYVSISDNITTNNGLTAYIVDGPNRYSWVADTNTFAVFAASDGPWKGASVVDVVDNYNIYNEPNTQNWGCTDLGLASSSQALYGSKDGSPDNLVTLIVDRRQVYLIGEVTTEVWTDVGNVIQGIITFPFQRVPGTSAQSGCVSPFSIARFANSFALVARDTRGDSTIELMDGYQYKRISTHAVEQSLVGYSTTDAVAYTYQIEGHEMYVVTFPSVGLYGLTWVYDLSTQQWHKWLSWDSDNAIYKRHRSNCGAFFANLNLVGDYENGKIYSIENNIYTDNGNTIRRLRRAVHITTDLQRQYFEEFQIQFQPGVGTVTQPGTETQDISTESDVTIVAEFVQGYLMTESGNQLVTESGDENESLVTQVEPVIDYNGYALSTNQLVETAGYTPQAMLRWSNDGGSTWSNEHWTSIGRIGAYQNRAIWRRLGWSRDRIFEVAISDPIKAVVVSANLKASAADN